MIRIVLKTDTRTALNCAFQCCCFDFIYFHWYRLQADISPRSRIQKWITKHTRRSKKKSNANLAWISPYKTNNVDACNTSMNPIYIILNSNAMQSTTMDDGRELVTTIKTARRNTRSNYEQTTVTYPNEVICNLWSTREFFSIHNATILYFVRFQKRIVRCECANVCGNLNGKNIGKDNNSKHVQLDMSR